MERGEYERLAAVEERGWWFQGLHDNLTLALRRAAARPDCVLLDAGCGTGGLLRSLARDWPQSRRFGIDLDPLAAAIARGKSGAAIAVASTAALPFPAASLDAVFSVDVLCHRGVDADATLRSIRGCLKPGGVAIFNLPAYRWLLSGHDLAVDNVRRFGRAEVKALLQSAGFARVELRSWNALLFPLMLAQRLTHRSATSDVALLPAPVERFFRGVVALETRLAATGLRFSFGGSILATAVKP